MLNFINFAVLVIIGDYDVSLVIVVLWVMRFLFCCNSSYVFGVVDIVVLYPFICASKVFWFIDEKKIPKNPAKSIRATLACLFTCVCIVIVL